MTNQQCRLIASAIVIVAGGLTLSLGLLARATNIYGSGGEAVGTMILLVGSVMFLVDYIKSWKDAGKERSLEQAATEQPQPAAEFR